MSLLDDEDVIMTELDLSVYKIHERLTNAEKDIKDLETRCDMLSEKSILLDADNKLIKGMVERVVAESVHNFDKLDRLKADLSYTKTAIHQLEDTVKLLAKEILLIHKQIES